MTESIYIPRGVNTDSLNRQVQWDFSPMSIKVKFLQYLKLRACCFNDTRSCQFHPFMLTVAKAQIYCDY